MPDPNPYRALPSVDELASILDSTLPWPLVIEVARAAIDEARDAIGTGDTPNVAELGMAHLRGLERRTGLVLVNATGVLLHTNLGRARWSEKAIERATLAARHTTDLEIDVDTGARGRRGGYVTELLGRLTGAEDALVVNNNAGALLLAVAATSSGLSVPVSRGELIEIGGSYRLPEVIAAGGGRLVEVGTTNRTRAADYANAIQLQRCGCILKIHPSNYLISGFTHAPTVTDLADLARDAGLPLIFDIGSGLLDVDTPWIPGPTPEWLRQEPAARQSLEHGSNLVTFSGDKLLGGPQAGVIVGDARMVGLLRSHPMARALRVDGVTLAALAATLEAHLENDVSGIPFWRQALLDDEALRPRAETVARALGGRVIEGISAIGAGSVPGVGIPGPVVVLDGEDRLFAPLLDQPTPVLARRADDSLHLDLRTVDPEMDETLIESVRRCR